MADEDDKVTLYEMSDSVRHWEISFGGSGLARLYVESFVDGGRSQSTCRLHFDGDVRPDVMRAVIDLCKAKVFVGLPPGVCIVYRGHLVASFDYGAKAN